MTPDYKELQHQLGVTRLADITGLDCLGIPVVQAVRPFSKSNAVSQGKGVALRDAARSALMESAESFFAERIERFPITIASAVALATTADTYQFHVDPAVRTRWPGWDIAWAASTNLLNGKAAHVPLELVHTAYVVPPADYDGVFFTSTTGLAVAGSHDHAVRHGLLECIERDSISRAHARHGFLQNNRFDPHAVQSSALDDVVTALRAKGFLIGLWLAPAVGDVPTVWCHLMEDCEADQAILANPAEGSAARLNLADAAIAAIHEAAQSRLTAISGARDDVGQDSYRTFRDRAKRDAHRRLLVEAPATYQLKELQRDEGNSAEADVAWLLAKLRENGITVVHEVILDTTPVEGLHAVKIIVPELQPLHDG